MLRAVGAILRKDLLLELRTRESVPAMAIFGGLSGYFADPDGHLWELAHNASFPLGADGGITIP